MFFGRTWNSLVLISIAVSLICACADNAINSDTGFAVYGRVTWRPPLSGLPIAEFYLFNNRNPVEGAVIEINGDTIPAAQSANGLYRWNVNINVGDTAFYSISSPVGSASGFVVIPDTIPIVRPARYDTLGTSSSHLAVWRANRFYDGYYAYLGGQRFDIGNVFETPQDTTFELPGDNLINFGIDTFWVETLRGVFIGEYAPNDMRIPRGVVGAAGNYCEIYFTLD